ncbi:MAG: hypothetical protein HN368_06815 [Spirochaetales bacterium]|jgi:uncharacterized protein|nr:hypothetical protein [Spirochaetales bacterium]
MMPFLLVSSMLSILIPMETLRFQWVYEQRYDYSCGAAALASLISIYWETEIHEEELLEILPNEDTPRADTTLLDLSRMVESLGFEAAAFDVSFEALTAAIDVYGPVIVHLNQNDGHYVLVIDYRDGFLIIGDPSAGGTAWTAARFKRLWSRVALIIRHKDRAFTYKAVDQAGAEINSRMGMLSNWGFR